MGIRKSYGKNKKDKRPNEAAAVERSTILRIASRRKRRIARRRRKPPVGARTRPRRPR